VSGESGAEAAGEGARRSHNGEKVYGAFIRIGVVAVERGDVVPHALVVAEIDAMIERHRARCA
jgi:hypothetical protein